MLGDVQALMSPKPDPDMKTDGKDNDKTGTGVKGKKKSAGFFLSLSYYLQSRSMSPMLSFSRVCQKKQERKLYLGNKSKGEILPISFLPFRRSWASQVEKNQKKTLSLSVSFFLSRPSRRASPSFKFIFIFLASYM